MKIVLTLVVVAGVASVVSGCGSSSSTTTTTSSPASQNPVTQAFKFSACMRDHGVTNFPDPQVSTTGTSTRIAVRVVGSKGDPKFRAAQAACQSIMPPPSSADLAAQAAQRRARIQDLLSFARCMRGRDINDFPDPGEQGQLTLAMITAAGVDLHAPQVAVAARACLPAAHGVITRADVAQATGSGG